MGEVRLFAGNFPPRSWAFCNGDLLPINVYEALYTIIGTTYGGDGQTTFAVPDLRGRLPIGAGTGPGLPNIQLGQISGFETQTLTIATMPTHSHQQMGSAGEPTQNSSLGASPATNGRSTSPAMPNIYTTQAASVPTGASTGPAGSNLPFTIVQPVSTSNFIICIEGIYPSRE